MGKKDAQTQRVTQIFEMCLALEWKPRWKSSGNNILDPIFHLRLHAKLINLVRNGQLTRSAPTAENINKDHHDPAYPEEQIGHICTVNVNQSYFRNAASLQYGAQLQPATENQEGTRL